MNKRYELSPVDLAELGIAGNAAIRVIDPPAFGGIEHFIADKSALESIVASLEAGRWRVCCFRLSDSGNSCDAIGLHDGEYLLVLNDSSERFFDESTHVFQFENHWELCSSHVTECGKTDMKAVNLHTLHTLEGSQITIEDAKYMGRVVAVMYLPKPFILA